MQLAAYEGPYSFASPPFDGFAKYALCHILKLCLSFELRWIIAVGFIWRKPLFNRRSDSTGDGPLSRARDDGRSRLGPGRRNGDAASGGGRPELRTAASVRPKGLQIHKPKSNRA
jgi:hypothetical protein